VEFPLDLWHRLASGRLMWRTGALVDRDTFTHTIAGQPIHNQNWLAELALYGLYELGGLELTQFVTGLCYVGAVAIVTHVAWQSCRDARLASFLGTVTLGLALSNLGIRTQVFATLLFALDLWALWCWPGRKRVIAIIALAELLWTNVHGTFPLGVILPATFAAGTALRLLSERSSLRADRDLRIYASSTLAALGAMFANPSPGQTLRYVANVVSRAPVRDIAEWAPTDLGSYAGVAFAASALGVIVVSTLARRPLDPTSWLLLILFALLGLRAQRFVIWWALAMPATLAPAVLSAVTTYGPRHEPEEEPSTGPAVVLAAIAVLVLMCTPWTRSYNPLLPPSKRASLSATAPRAAMEFLRSHERYERLFNPMELGGYLSWELDDHTQVFIDPRIDFFPDDVWSDYRTIGAAAPGWQPALDAHRVDAVLWDRRLGTAPLAALAGSPHWRKVYADEQVTVFARTPPP
jgi:hypothetical protein